MNKTSLKKSLLTTASAFAIGAFASGVAFAATQTDNTDDASTAALTVGNAAAFTAPAAGTDEVFTVADTVAVGDTGVVVSATTANLVGTLTFSGDSTATGTIGATGNRLGILNAGVTGKTVSITADAFAVTTNVTGTGTIAFGGNLTGTSLSYDADGVVTIADGKTLTAAVTNDTGTTSKGTLTFTAAGTMTGQVGASGASLLKVNVATGNGNKTVAFDGDVFATTIQYGTDAGATATFTDGSDVTGAFVSGGDNLGVITFSGDSKVTGTIGTSAAVDFNILNVGAAGKTVTITGNVFAVKTNITGAAGTLALQADITGAVDFDAENTLTLADNSDITGALDATAASDGTLTTAGSSTISGLIGATNAITKINANGGTGEVLQFGATVKTVDLNFGGDGIVNVDTGANLTNTNAITTSTNKTGTLQLDGNTTVAADIGVATTGLLKLVTVNAGATAGKTATFSGDVYASTVNFADDATADNSTISVASGKDITAAITTSTNNSGTLTLVGGASVITGNVGTSSANLAAVNTGANGATDSITGNVFAKGFNVTGTGTTTLTGDATVGTDNLVFAAAGTLALADNSDITGAITATGAGNITFAGSSTISGNAGLTGARLGTLNINSASASDTVRFSGDVFAATFDADDAQSGTTIRIDQGKTVTATNSITATLAGAAKYQFGIKEVDGIATDAGDTVGKIASGAAILMTDASYDALIDGTGKSIVDGSVYKIADGVGAATVATNTTATDNSWRLSFSAVRGDNAAVTTALGAAGSNSDIYLLADVENALNESSTKVNEKAVGSALETIGNSGDAALDTITAALDGLSSAAAVENALATLDADVSGSTTSAAIDAADAGTGVVESRVEQLAGISGTGVAAGGASYNNGVWGEVFGTAADQDDRKGVRGYQAETGGVAIGADTKLDDENTIGASLAYAQTDADSANGTTEIDSYQGNVYGMHDYGKWFADGLLGFTYNNFDTTRNVVVGNISDKAKGDFDGQQYTLKVGGGYKLDVEGGLNVTPVASLKYDYLSLDKYTETGSSADLTIDNEDIHSLKSNIGVNLNYPIVDGDITYIPAISTGWTYDFIGDEQETTNNFTGAASTLFTNKGAKVAQNAFNVGLGLDVLAQDNVTVSFDYDWKAKEDYNAHTGAVKARFAF